MLLGNVVTVCLCVIFKLSVSRSFEKPLVGPSVPFVVLPTWEKPMVVTSVCSVVPRVEVLTEGEVVGRPKGVMDSALGVVGGITLIVVVGTAVVVGTDVSVGGDCVVAVVDVVAVGTVGSGGVSFLLGVGVVGVGGLNLTMRKHK